MSTTGGIGNQTTVRTTSTRKPEALSPSERAEVERRSFIVEGGAYNPQDLKEVACILKEKGFAVDENACASDVFNAIETFQRDNGLKPDRKVGDATWSALLFGISVKEGKVIVAQSLSQAPPEQADDFELGMSGYCGPDQNLATGAKRQSETVTDAPVPVIPSGPGILPILGPAAALASNYVGRRGGPAAGVPNERAVVPHPAAGVPAKVEGAKPSALPPGSIQAGDRVRLANGQFAKVVAVAGARVQVTQNRSNRTFTVNLSSVKPVAPPVQQSATRAVAQGQVSNSPAATSGSSSGAAGYKTGDHISFGSSTKVVGEVIGKNPDGTLKVKALNGEFNLSPDKCTRANPEQIKRFQSGIHENAAARERINQQRQAAREAELKQTQGNSPASSKSSGPKALPSPSAPKSGISPQRVAQGLGAAGIGLSAYNAVRTWNDPHATATEKVCAGGAALASVVAVGAQRKLPGVAVAAGWLGLGMGGGQVVAGKNRS